MAVSIASVLEFVKNVWLSRPGAIPARRRAASTCRSDALDDLGMAMAHGRCEDSAEEVQVFPTVNVPHPDTFTFIQNQRLLI